jgi:hypothetical protein
MARSTVGGLLDEPESEAHPDALHNMAFPPPGAPSAAARGTARPWQRSRAALSLLLGAPIPLTRCSEDQCMGR